MDNTSGAAFDAAFLRALGADIRLPLCLRVLMLAAERMDADGIARFERGEMRRLLAFADDGPNGRPEGSTRSAVHEARRRRYIGGGSTTNAVVLDPARVRRVGK